MSHFVLQENPDGTVNLAKKEKVLAEVCGKVVYINPKNRKLFQIHAEKMDKKFRCVLSYPNPFCPLKEGDAIFGIAEYVEDNRYGATLNIIQPPFVAMGQDKNTVIKSFTSALRGSGFGNIRAHKLLEALIVKTGSLNNAINTLDRMASFYNYKNESDNGPIIPYTTILKEKQMLRLLEWWYKNRNLRRLWLLGINNTEIRNSKMAPEQMYQICLENPYKITSLKIEKCENIMNRIGKETRPSTKSCAEITRKLKDFMDRGWSGVPSRILVNTFPDVKVYLEELKRDFGVKTELHTAYLPYAYEVEVGITDLVNNLLDQPNLPHSMNPSEITYTRPDLSEDQKRAIEGSLRDNISIIRGKAGSGKTSTIKEIIHNLKEKGIKYQVVSFTGKAVSRIREVIDQKEPMTMHMSITTSSKQKQLFSHLIIDEASMVTSELFYDFTQRFGHDFRITFIGDPNQLTPIGWGTLFEQLIKSGIVPTYTLTKCHRTIGDGNGILSNANLIVEHSDPEYNGPPFQFNEETDSFQIVEGNISIIKDLIEILRNNGTPNEKITIICPFNKDLVEINKICQTTYNDLNRSARDTRGTLWRINDRVMMTENNYAINVMNGDEGVITDLTADQLQVTFKDGTEQIFSLDVEDPDQHEDRGSKKVLTTGSLIHSFGVSVHRYQGSEAEYVIFYIPESKPTKFLNRNLLYTGVTRAKRVLWMVGHYDTMLRSATTPPPYRCDNLAQRLKQSRTVNL